MLFSLDPQTPRSKIFTALNKELLYFLKASINADRFRQGLFTRKVGKACWENEPTKKEFENVWSEICLLSVTERQQLFDAIKDVQDIKTYFANRTTTFPEILPEELNKKLKDLTVHLYKSTKDLAKIRDSCDGETVQDHFNEFRRLNGKVCQTCGTELLAQNRSDIAEEDQWRADYDHLLSKDKYPVFAIHPDNLLPLCHTCNSKAKGAKQLLFSNAGLRRLSFYPHYESCYHLINVELQDDITSLQLIVWWNTPNADIAEKMTAWDEVYQVKARVQEEESDFIVWIDNECRPTNYNDFENQLRRKAQQPTKLTIQNECWQFWRFKLYAWIEQQGEEVKKDLWTMLQQRRSDPDYCSVYGI